MLWQGRRESGNVEDRRGIGGGGIAVGGGILGVIALLVNYLLVAAEEILSYLFPTRINLCLQKKKPHRIHRQNL